MYEMPDILLDDEEATLEECSIKNGHLLWLEEGKVGYYRSLVSLISLSLSLSL
jgi:hypothetical protein